MATLGKIVYLTEAQYATLRDNGSITVEGVTVTYSDNDIYVTDQLPYRTASAQDLIDAAQDTAIDGKAPKAAGVYYGVCATAAGTQAKTVTVTGLSALYEGAAIAVLFQSAQNYNGAPTLNVNGLGAKPILRVTGTNAGVNEWQSGEVLTLFYNGTGWVVEGGVASTSYYGRTRLYTGGTSTSENRALTPASLNSLAEYMISGAGVYANGTAYAVGDLVRNGYVIYRRKTAGTDSAWTAGNWDEIEPLLTLIDGIHALIPAGASTSNKLATAGDIPADKLAILDAETLPEDLHSATASALATGKIVALREDISPEVDLYYLTYCDSDGLDSTYYFTGFQGGTMYLYVLTDSALTKSTITLTGKADAPAVITQHAPSAITLADNTIYYLSSVSSLTLTYPASGHWECLIVLTTASSGTISVTLPSSSYIGYAPTFGNSETWELSIRDGVVVAGKAVASS